MSGEQTDFIRETLQCAMRDAGVDAEGLAGATKIPRSTILHFLGQDAPAVLPGPVYLRGHLRLLAKELRLDADALAESFDRSRPQAEPEADRGEGVYPPAVSKAVAAGLACAGILAVIVAFAG